MNYRRSILLLVSILVFSKCKAQTPLLRSNYKTEDEFKQAYLDKAKSLGIGMSSYFYSKKININKYETFKKYNLDFAQFDFSDWKCLALIKDIVIVGTVVGRQYDADSTKCFHTQYKVLLAKKIKGTFDSDTATIITLSGPIGKDAYVNTSDEKELFIGENILIFGHKINLDIMKNLPKGEFNFNNCTNVNALEPSYGIDNKYIVKGNYAYDEFGKKIESIKEITNVVIELNKINISDEN